MGQNLISHTKSASKLWLTTHLCAVRGTSTRKYTHQAAGGVFFPLFVWLWSTQSPCFTLVFPPILPHTQTRRFKHRALTPVPMATASIGDQPPGSASRSFLPPHCPLRTGPDIWRHHLNANTLTSPSLCGVQLGSIGKLPLQNPSPDSTLIPVSPHLV